MNSKEFLTELFDGKPDGSHILIWTLKNKRSGWFKTTARAALYVDTLGSKENVYFGCGVSPRDCGPTNRCPADEITGIPGFYADIDIKGPSHKDPNP